MYKLLISIFAFIFLLGCQHDKPVNDQPADTLATPDSSSKSLTIDFKAIDRMISKSPDTVTVATIKTKFGSIEIEFYTSDAPKTVSNFIGLAMSGYYNNVIFHRIAKDYVLQGGDPTGTGSGGTSIYGNTFEDELNKNATSYKEGYRRGVVAMANRGPDTNSSQFFIMLGDAPGLPKAYSVFGKVIKGMEVVDEIAAQKINPVFGPADGRPVSPVKMESVTIEKRARKLNSIFEVR
ncbi:MAG: peptidylprolyl isomerase [Ignavibacteria bacterium]